MASLLKRFLGAPETKSAWHDPYFWSLDANPLALTIGPRDREKITNDFEGYANGALKGNGVIFAVSMVRQLILSEARFVWRRFRDGKPGDVFSTAELDLLARPWRGATTGALIARMDQDATLAGNAFFTTAADGGRIGLASVGGANRRLVRLRPDWCTILMGSHDDPNNEDPNAITRQILGLIYDPPNANGARNTNPVTLLPDEFAHYAPIPDPTANFRGMSWITPIVKEVQADQAATVHKLAFFENGASPKLVASMPQDLPFEKYKAFVQAFKEQHQGATNAYRTLFLGGGADLTVAGADLKQLDFKVTQGAGETRIAAAAGVHPTIVGLSEGMQGSALNAGNYAATRRRFADGTLRPTWREMAGSLEILVKRPGSDVALWYDERDVAFLREDAKDNADIRLTDSSAIRNLTEAGYVPDSVVAAIVNNDMTMLKHSGVFSVQLQPAGGQGQDNNDDNVDSGTGDDGTGSGDGGSDNPPSEGSDPNEG